MRHENEWKTGAKYFLRETQEFRHGPYDLEGLQELLDRRELGPDTMVEVGDEWIPLEDIEGLDFRFRSRDLPNPDLGHALANLGLAAAAFGIGLSIFTAGITAVLGGIVSMVLAGLCIRKGLLYGYWPMFLGAFALVFGFTILLAIF